MARDALLHSDDEDDDDDDKATGSDADANDSSGSRHQANCCRSKVASHMERPRFADHGVIESHLSHDGSPHVTDEVFNAASHLMGGMLSILGAAVLITGACAHGDPWAIVAFSLYGACLVFLFFSSFLHHGVRGSHRMMRLFRKLDYVGIYLLIPGTMMPVCLVCLHATWVGWVFFGTTISLALMGIIMQIACTGPLELPMWASMTIYVTLGWFGAFLAVPAHKCLGLGGSMLLLAGGLAYTGGGLIFTLQCPNPVPHKFGFHEIWHVFVLLGAGLHWAAMFFYVWPAMKTS